MIVNLNFSGLIVSILWCLEKNGCIYKVVSILLLSIRQASTGLNTVVVN